jgi:hypothetical protein
MNTDKAATAAGGVMSLGVLSQINWGLLFGGDAAEVGKLVLAIGAMTLGWLANKVKK